MSYILTNVKWKAVILTILLLNMAWKNKYLQTYNSVHN